MYFLGVIPSIKVVALPSATEDEVFLCDEDDVDHRPIADDT